MSRTLVVLGGAVVVIGGLVWFGRFAWNCWPMVRQNFPWLNEGS